MQRQTMVFVSTLGDTCKKLICRVVINFNNFAFECRSFFDELFEVLRVQIQWHVATVERRLVYR